jgi:two-component system sensor histidine kinase BaeS
MPLQRRLGLAIAASVLAAVSISLLVGAYLVRRSIEHTALNGLRRQVALLAKEDLHPTAGPIGRFLTTQDERLSVLPRRQAQLLLPDSPSGRITVSGRDYFYASKTTGPDVVVLLRTASSVRSDSQPFWYALASAGGVGCLLALAVATALARGIARPVVRVAQASRRLAAGESPEPLPVSGSRELRTLADSFNTMADQIRRAREAERSFLLSVSHELKTPLTAIRGYAEALEEGVLTPERAVRVIRTEAARLERLVTDLLHLARLEQQRFDIQPATVDLAEIARETATRHAARHDRACGS